MEKYFLLALTLTAMFGFIYGVVQFFRKRTALYARMIVFGIGCVMLGRLFETLRFFTTGEFHEGFRVSVLGTLGSFLFFLTANYGQMDSLVDDRSPVIRKYRIIAVLAPLTVAGLYVLYFRYAGFGEDAIVNGIISLVICQTTYFQLKHLIIPDVEGGSFVQLDGDPSRYTIRPNAALTDEGYYSRTSKYGVLTQK